MGDKTQLLALILAARFRKPWTVMAGILAATLVNHALASWAGSRLTGLVSPLMLQYGLALTFFIFAAWILIPDKEDGESAQYKAWGAFLTTAIAFFLAEMGDKTQLVTVALGARFADPIAVTLGTTLGMLAADGLAVFFGDRITQRISMTWIRRATAALFGLFGLLCIFGDRLTNAFL